VIEDSEDSAAMYHFIRPSNFLFSSIGLCGPVKWETSAGDVELLEKKLFEKSIY
jgi:hypothetical protein